jgi:2-polyprenyl-3-methyl-5-hydroxy-6-metoxy-1,4-benzoquinol methylase
VTESDQREFWNQRYRAGHGEALPPDPFLAWAYESFVKKDFSVPRDALDVASGVGRHTIWLAEQGWNVTAVDVSDAALETARNRTAPLSIQVNFVREEIETFLDRAQLFDLVVVFLFLDRTLFSRIQNALRPGGILIYKTYTSEQTRFGVGPRNPEHLLNPGELSRAFPGLRVLHCAEIVEQSATAELVAVKPRV